MGSEWLEMAGKAKALPKIKIPKIVKIFILFSIIVVFSAWYVAYLWFVSDNSYEVYQDLKIKKTKLEKNIKILQLYNAKLQKEYFELKNLEPEQ